MMQLRLDELQAVAGGETNVEVYDLGFLEGGCIYPDPNIDNPPYEPAPDIVYPPFEPGPEWLEIPVTEPVCELPYEIPFPSWYGIC